MEYASRGTSNTALGFGIAGTALSLLNGGAGLMGILPGNKQEEYVTKESLNMAMTIASKDSEIALLKSEQNTEVKIADVYERIMTRVNSDAKNQADWNAAQAVYNATNTAGISCLQNQISQLQAMTKMVIPSGNVCPNPMPLYNSWTAPNATTAG